MQLIQILLSIAEAGSHLVLYLLVALSVLSIGQVLERAVFFARRRVDPSALGQAISAKLKAHDLAGARALLGGSRSVEAKVLSRGLEWYEAGPGAVEEVLAAAIKEERRSLDGGQLFLGTVGSNAPFIGLFGTVLGIVTAFRELGTANVAAMGNVMTGIAEALVATAVGIFVAIPAVVAFNAFQSRSARIEENAAVLGHLVLAELKREVKS